MATAQLLGPHRVSYGGKEITGEHVVSTKYGSATNWVASVAPNGSVRRDPGKDPSIPGSLVSPTAGGTVNWEPPAFSPQTGLFYVMALMRGPGVLHN
jgi:hypothetical protein